MIKTRIAGAAALVTFGLAALGGTAVAIATPAGAETGTGTTATRVDGTSMTGTAGPAVNDARAIPNTLADATRGPEVSRVPAPGSAASQRHDLFPHSPSPHGDHDGQGHKGSNEHRHVHVS
jgi:hypothetical protein